MNDLVGRRMRRQNLWGPPLTSVDDVVRGFGAMQAQEFRPAKWSIAQRASGVTEVDVDAAFAAGRLLRTHVLRPTWHFVHADDIGWILSASAPRVHAANAYYYRQTGVDDDVTRRSRAVFERVLGDGTHLTRKELAAHLAEAGMAVTGVPLAYVIIRAELDGVLVSGAMKGNQQTYALLDVRVPGWMRTDRDEALAELTRHYYARHGPATVRDYRTWASLTAAEARRGIDLVGSAMVSETIDDRTYWLLTVDDDAAARARPPGDPVIDLLQDFDEYVIGYSESRDVILTAGGPTETLRARLRPVLLDGRLVGYWRHALTASAVEIETVDVPAFRGVRAAAMQAAADRFGAFVGRPARWR
ncbi:MAG TPA: winged helix DNA-binding domain-containing protein [Micromonosporaceae bacterium]|nr:winged helix DNA-binding domain-containing protein [Micromonosporaceae bacterium]